MPGEIYLMRHGETAWSLSGQHTSRTDLPLTDQGRLRATALRGALAGHKFQLVLSSPMKRAVDTCRLAGFEPILDPDLHEWDYGSYEGLTTDQIQQSNPGWTIWTASPPGGETAAQIGERAGRVIERSLAIVAGSSKPDVALFAHGHVLRVLASCWLGLTPESGRYLALSTGSVSVLGWERETRVVRLWNDVP